jgi:hypothetical protein
VETDLPLEAYERLIMTCQGHTVVGRARVARRLFTVGAIWSGWLIPRLKREKSSRAGKTGSGLKADLRAGSFNWCSCPTADSHGRTDSAGR